MIAHLVFFASLFAAALLFALVEVQIEGPDGWAKKLPTWRIENRWTRLFYASRPLTGYHLYLQLFVLLVVHLPFLGSLAAWTWQGEARVLSFMILFWVLEDYLWFAVNPAFGPRKFRKENIWWHGPTWWWIMPRDYWLFGPLGVALYLLSVVSCS